MTVLRHFIPPPVFVLIVLGWFANSALNDAERLTHASASENPAALPSNVQSATNQPVALPIPESGDYQAQIAEVASRPLFSPTRRKPEPDIIEKPEPEYIPEPASTPPPSAPPPVAPPRKPELEYRGLIGAEGVRSALLHDKANSAENWVAVSDVISDWIVAEITTSFVRLTNGEHEFIVEVEQ